MALKVFVVSAGRLKEMNLAWSIAAYKGNIERVCMHMLGLSYNLVCEMKKSAE